MTTIIPFRSATLPPGELAAVLAEVTAALPAGQARLVESKGTTMLDPATLALFLGAGATALAGLLSAVATVWAARLAARRADERPRTLIIVVETAQTTVRLAVDVADPAAVVAAPLPALSDVVAVRLEM